MELDHRPSTREDLLPEMSRSYKHLLKLLGENSERQGLLKTPERAAKAMLFFTKGYDQSLEGEVIYKMPSWSRLPTVGIIHISYNLRIHDPKFNLFKTKYEKVKWTVSQFFKVEAFKKENVEFQMKKINQRLLLRNKKQMNFHFSSSKIYN